MGNPVERSDFRHKAPRRTMNRNRIPIKYPKLRLSNRSSHHRSRSYQSGQNRRYFNEDACSGDLLGLLLGCTIPIVLLLVLIMFFSSISTTINAEGIIPMIMVFATPVIVCILLMQDYNKEERPKPDLTEYLVKKGNVRLPRERTSQICEFCHYRNYISKKFCLNCRAPLPLMSESLKGGDQSLYRKTYKRDVKNKKTKQFSREHLSCHICGYLINIGMDACPDCGTKRIKCPICLRHLNFTDDIAYCFFCETNFHFSHLMEWIKMKTTCPTCKKRLLMSEVVRKYTNEKTTKIFRLD